MTDGSSRSENWVTLESPEAAELISQATTFATVLGAAVQRFAAAVLPNVDTVQAYVGRPNVQARIHQVADFAEAARRRIEAVDAPGYTPYFERMGQSGFRRASRPAWSSILAGGFTRKTRRGASL